MNKGMKSIISAAMLTMAIVMPSCAGNKANSGISTTGKAAEPTLQFSGDSALRFAERQVKFGPRIPGSSSHSQAAAWMAEQLKGYGAEVSTLRGELKTFDGATIPMINILASLNPESEERILIIAHWDTRPWADEDKDPALRREPIDGANDGASGTAVAMELARVLCKNSQMKKGVDILLADAEDWGEEGNDESWAMGARHFAENDLGKLPSYPSAAIVVDMVGDKGAEFRREYFSMQSAPGLTRRIWETARELGYGDIFINEDGCAITDDHVPMIEAGIPSVDIVDYRTSPEPGFPPQWHTTGDTVEKLSGKTLEAVGRTLERLLTEE